MSADVAGTGGQVADVADGNRLPQENGNRKRVIIGPWGGNGGTSWDDGSSTYHGVREIKVVYDLCIDSIVVVYDKYGKPFMEEKHGGIGGNKVAQIKLQYPQETIVSVSGHYSPVVHGGSAVIRSLTFKTNMRTFGPFGVGEGTPFTLPLDGGRIMAFMGRSDWHLDAIGFRVSRAQETILLEKAQKKLQSSNTKRVDLLTKSFSNLTKCLEFQTQKINNIL